MSNDRFDDCLTIFLSYINPRMKKPRHPDILRIRLADVMHALADPCRVKIIRHLLVDKKRAFACNEFPLKVSKATKSHHFNVLRRAGLIQSRFDGTRCMTSLRFAEIEEHFPGLLELIATSK